MLKHKSKLLVILIAFWQILVTAPFIHANEQNHYLPMGSDILLALELEKLATVARMPQLTKPYKVATVSSYLDKISQSHPILYNRIKNYLKRYDFTNGFSHFSVGANHSSGQTKNLPNKRGQNTDSQYQANLAGYLNLGSGFSLAIGGLYYDNGEFIPNNTYLSYSTEYAQLDIGFKELWLSPLQESSMLLSTNAKPEPSFSLSSPKPISDWDIRYELSFGKLEKMQGILFDDVRSSGQPGFLKMHLSFKPTNWWTLGASRTMIFGGGNREVDLSQVWDAIVDPINSDNCGGVSDLQDCDQEFGNQQASISNRFDFNIGTPISLYLELAGEDSGGYRWYALGNRAYNVGLFIPYLSDKSSFLIEHQLIRLGWYTHHLYEEGYRNDLDSLGHWWGDEKAIDDKIGARISTLRYTYELNDEMHLDFKYATIENGNFGDEGADVVSTYDRAHEFTIGISQIEDSNVWRYELYTGNDTYGENFARFSISYVWQ